MLDARASSSSKLKGDIIGDEDDKSLVEEGGRGGGEGSSGVGVGGDDDMDEDMDDDDDEDDSDLDDLE